MPRPRLLAAALVLLTVPAPSHAQAGPAAALAKYVTVQVREGDAIAVGCDATPDGTASYLALRGRGSNWDAYGAVTTSVAGNRSIRVRSGPADQSLDPPTLITQPPFGRDPWAATWDVDTDGVLLFGWASWGEVVDCRVSVGGQQVTPIDLDSSRVARIDHSDFTDDEIRTDFAEARSGVLVQAPYPLGGLQITQRYDRVTSGYLLADLECANCQFDITGPNQTYSCLICPGPFITTETSGPWSYRVRFAASNDSDGELYILELPV